MKYPIRREMLQIPGRQPHYPKQSYVNHLADDYQRERDEARYSLRKIVDIVWEVPPLERNDMLRSILEIALNATSGSEER